MSKTLVIVESPTKGEKIQGYLGKNYIVVASKGHITELASGGHHGIGVDVDNKFKPHYVISKDKVSTVRELMDLASKVDDIILMTDPDREGEAIAWHLYERLKDFDKPMKRALTKEIKAEAIKKAIKNASDIDLKMVASQQARQSLDRIVGFTASPFLMATVAPKLSSGRVQSPVTRLVVDREIEIENFKPEDFWTIQAKLSDGTNSFFTKYPNKLTNASDAKAISDKLSAPDVKYIVSDVTAAQESKSAPPPFITSTLQQHCSRASSLDAADTMKAAQSLYEHGLITYMRTDSVRIEPENIENAREYLKAAGKAIPKKANSFSNKDAAQDAHEAIRPTDLSITPGAKQITDGAEKTVYEAIWRQFLASQMNPALYNTLKVTVKANGVELKASGKALKDKGFLEMLNVTDDNKIDIPNLSKGDEVTLTGKNPVLVEKKQTQAPPRYSQSNLLKELEKRGIGRPATYADLLTKIEGRDYVAKKGNVYHATDLGKQVVGLLKNYFTFMDYDYTAKLENQLDEIGQGKITYEQMLDSFYKDYKKELDGAYTGEGNDLCDKCGNAMRVITTKTQEKFLGCTNYPKCKNTKKIK